MTLPADFDITLEFLSDWHIGTGQGRLGTVDAEVRRAAGLPFVPAKSLLGVWRDACETVASTFDLVGSVPGAWQAWVTWLFGSQPDRRDDATARAGKQPLPATLRLTPVQAPAWLREAVRVRPALAQATVVLRPGVAINDDTGTAEARTLRVEERAIRGLRLHSRVSVIPDHEGHVPLAAEVLLRAGARLVEGVGGNRNRGSGRVAMLLPNARLDTGGVHPRFTDPRLVDLLAAGVPTPDPPPPTLEESVAHPAGRLSPGARRTVRLVLDVVTPVVAAQEVLGNVISSRDSIPGTALLGTILSRVEQGAAVAEQPNDGPAGAGSNGSDGVGLGDVSVGDAVPAAGDRADLATVAPAHRVPMVWQRSDKGRGEAVFNTLLTRPGQEQRAKAMGGRIAAADAGWRQVGVARTFASHAVIDDDARRPTVNVGGPYTYVGIAPGTLLCSDISLPVGTRLRLAVGEHLRFGRSRKDDFGLVRVLAVVDPAPSEPQPGPGQGTLRVWCVSDVLLRDERLVPDPTPHALARALSEALTPARFEVTATECAVAVVRRDGFGVAWGRPRPSQVAMSAGSVVSLTVSGTVNQAQLAELERNGIGERTVEGYGRIRFNPPELAVAAPRLDFATEQPQQDAGARSVRSEGGIGPADPPHPIEINAWRRAIRRASAEADPDTVIRHISRLSGNPAQLGALRTQMERLSLPDGPSLVRAWIEATRAVRARRETWSDAVLRDLQAVLLDEPELIWHRLGLSTPHQRDLVLLPGREPLLRLRLRPEAVITAVTDALGHLNANGRADTVAKEEHR